MDCPSDQVKRWLLSDELSGSALDAVSAHVDECSACQQALERLTSADVEYLKPVPSDLDGQVGDLEFLAEIKQRGMAALAESAGAGVARLGNDRPPSAAECVLDKPPAMPTFPGYTVSKELGRGGMGAVYLGRDDRLQRDVAIKVADTRLLPDATRLERFRVEALAMARLKHPHIIEIYDVGDADGLAFIALEFAAGGTLNELIAGRSISWQWMAQTVETLARAVHFAHQKGLVHRDLKPSNVLFSAEGVPKISDFGLVKQLGEDPGWTRTGDVIGTPSYMAPEQVRGAPQQIGPHTDVYALGVILYELLTGATPFCAATPLQVMTQVLEREPPSPSSINRSTPRDLVSICLQCLHKEPARRYATAQALADDLGRFLAGETVAARRAGLVERSWRWSRRRPSLTALIAVVMLLAMVGFPGATLLWLDASRARDLAEQSEAAQRWSTYRANIAAAGSFLELNNTTAARRALDATPEEHRNWEWNHFDHRLQGAKLTMSGHAAAVSGVAVSPDGRRLASTSTDGSVLVWDTETGELIATLAGQDRVSRDAQLEFSPDGRWLLAAGPNNTANIWDARTCELRTSLAGHASNVMGCRFSGDGTKIVTRARGEPSCRVWNTATAELIKQIDVESSIRGAFFRPGANEVAIYQDDGSVGLWNAASGDRIACWRAHQTFATAMAISPDGKLLATGGDYGDNDVKLWSVPQGELVAVLGGHENAIYSIAFSPDGTVLASGTADNTVGLWDVERGASLAMRSDHNGPVYQVAFSPDGTLLASASRDQTVRLRDPVSGRLIALLHGHSDAIQALAFDRRSTTLFSASHDQTIAAWDVVSRKNTGVLRGHAEDIGDVTFSADGSYCASASWDGTVRVWDVEQAQEVLKLSSDAPVATGIVYHPSGRQLVAVDRQSLTVWDAHTGEQLLREKLPRGHWPDRRVAISPDGRLLATGTLDGELWWWNAETWQQLAKSPAHELACRDVAFSPDSRFLVTVSNDGSARVWNADTREPIATLRGHTRPVTCASFDHSGSLIVTGSEDGTARVWDAVSYEQRETLNHGSYLYDVAFSPNGERLAVACDNHSIRLWDVESWSDVGQLLGHEAFVWALTFSPDGTKLLSGSGDNTLRIWDTLSPFARGLDAPPVSQLRGR